MERVRIGPYTLANPWILAPMAGVSEMPFRVLAREMGAAAAPTELVSAKGLLYGQARSRRYLTHDASENPFWVQIFGGEPEVMAEGAERAQELGADIIDINMGCPVKKVTRHGAGSALLCDPARAAAVVAAIVKRTGLPVTAKIRTGWDDTTINASEMCRRLADAGAVAVAIHARTRAQGYAGRADWALIARVVEASPIPVLGNGDVFTPADGHRMLRETACAAVLIGRGALGNPWIFRQLSTGDWSAPTPDERWQLVRRHLESHLLFAGDITHGIRRFRQHLLWYAHGLRGAAGFRREATVINELPALIALSEEFFLSAGGDSIARAEVEFDARAALG
ncbi:MAG: tRNA dihydrouridine synthase DusB [Deltaproteobacteria bacterium]|nr:tRNA dihydrouridine synthase DusB [Deltaproteobacteria bacterium]